MQHIKTIYDMVSGQHPNKIVGCVRKGDLSPLLPIPLGPGDSELLLAHAKKQEASKLSSPYLLSDYLCYIFDGTEQQFAEQQNATDEDVAQAIYSGHYWHEGAVYALSPATLGRAPDKWGGLVRDFVGRYLTFGEGRTHTTAVWQLFVLYCTSEDKEPMPRRLFGTELTAELSARGYHEQQSVRIGAKVTRGYKNISVKNI